MSLAASGGTWEEASSPETIRLTRRFEAAWRNAKGRRPDPDDFLPDEDDALPAARLALLRADLALRWEAGERARVEGYRDRYVNLDEDTLVALIYEEFCLREDASESPDPAEYLGRFPEVAARLHRVLDIHGLVGSGTPPTTAPHAPSAPAIPFPETGQTIAGFHLVEELGRGAFARVFRAEERQLADRPVALKVARAGSREPQTLARLQHTHIVPVHSYRTDPATGLHLLCMPYFGRVTLAMILADPVVKVAPTGADFIAALDRLGSSEGPRPERSAGRSALRQRTFAQAIAWWGARMAEALEHAHDRGVLHRDVKPSNVLVTDDAMPMLLDFNLAREPMIEDPEAAPETLGGTLDYMAPEHLMALADGVADRVDGRADIYGLGVLLFEAVMGSRPFPPPRDALSMSDALLRAAEERSAAAPGLRATRPDVPAALEAVIRRCLEPEPDDRYASAADLAADLRAVADDRPLRFAREPIPSRAVRWVRRNRRPILMAVPIVLAVTTVAAALVKLQLDDMHIESEVSHLIDEGELSAGAGEFAQAMSQFESAARLARERHDFFGLWAGAREQNDLFAEAREGYNLAKQTRDIRAHADALFDAAESLRFCLLDFGGDLASASTELQKVLKPFFVFESDDWVGRPDLTLLDPTRRTRLFHEVNELLFLWAVALDRTGDGQAVRLALTICDRAIAFSRPRDPWIALRAWIGSRSRGGAADPAVADDPPAETSALACFQWGLLRELQEDIPAAIEWLKQAILIDPSDYWYQYYLAYNEDLVRSHVAALNHYNCAVALRPKSPWVRFSRARLYRIRGAWKDAREDYQLALACYRNLPDSARDPVFEQRVRLELGLIHQSLGDLRGARVEYDAVIADDPDGLYARAARLNRAKLDADSGAIESAMAGFNALLEEDPHDTSTRLGRALLALRIGRAAQAEADLSELIRRTRGNDAELLAHRSMARLALGRPALAEADAERAFRIDPRPGHERLRNRALLAMGRDEALRLDDPVEIARLRTGGPPIDDDLRASAGRLGAAQPSDQAAALRVRMTRAVILAALRDPEAVAEADRAVAMAPLSADVLLVRARIHHHLGRPRLAGDDVERGLDLQPGRPRLLELRGLLKVEAGEPLAGLDDFDHAIRQGADGSIRGPRAVALLALGRPEEAVGDWSIALSHDPEDPHAYLGRARAFLRLRKWDQALADLEQAAGWSGDDPSLNFLIARAYARCLIDRPNRLPRVLTLARRAWSTSLARVIPPIRPS